MNYRVEFHPKAAKEFLKLDGRVKKLVARQIAKLEKKPAIGQLLGNKQGLDLTSCRKLYVDNKRFRIVYEVIDQQVVIFIFAIGNRDEMKVYKDASKRKNTSWRILFYNPLLE